MNTYHYTYLIINLRPTTGERYYIGVHSGKINPHDDSNYMGSSKHLTEAIKNEGIYNFEKIIIECWPSRSLALAHEIQLHKSYNVKDNKLFYNKVNQTSTGFDCTGNIESDATRLKKSISIVRVLNSKSFKEGKGKIANKNHSITKSNPIWKDTIGKAQVEKRLTTISTTKWKEKHTFVCPHCKKSIQNKANLNRWHNNNCKSIR